MRFLNKFENGKYLAVSSEPDKLIEIMNYNYYQMYHDGKTLWVLMYLPFIDDISRDYGFAYERSLISEIFNTAKFVAKNNSLKTIIVSGDWSCKFHSTSKNPDVVYNRIGLKQFLLNLSELKVVYISDEIFLRSSDKLYDFFTKPLVGGMRLKDNKEFNKSEVDSLMSIVLTTDMAAQGDYLSVLERDGVVPFSEENSVSEDSELTFNYTVISRENKLENTLEYTFTFDVLTPTRENLKRNHITSKNFEKFERYQAKQLWDFVEDYVRNQKPHLGQKIKVHCQFCKRPEDVAIGRYFLSKNEVIQPNFSIRIGTVASLGLAGVLWLMFIISPPAVKHYNFDCVMGISNSVYSNWGWSFGCFCRNYDLQLQIRTKSRQSRTCAR